MDPHSGQPVVTAGAPLERSRGVVIMLHGRNAGPENILELVPAFERPSFTYLAPSAASHTWYPYSFMVDIAKNEPYLTSALRMLERLVDQVVARGIPRERVLLLGFSQGACLAGEFAVRHASRYGGVVLFSGGLIGPPGTQWKYPGSFDRTPVFLGCSDVDPHIPAARVEESAHVFAAMAASVTKRLYRGMGHTVNDDEIAVAVQFMDQVLADARPTA
jgi:predicted esterase